MQTLLIYDSFFVTVKGIAQSNASLHSNKWGYCRRKRMEHVKIYLHQMSKSVMEILKIAPTFDNPRQFFVFSREDFDSFNQVGRQ